MAISNIINEIPIIYITVYTTVIMYRIYPTWIYYIEVHYASVIDATQGNNYELSIDLNTQSPYNPCMKLYVHIYVFMLANQKTHAPAST